MGSFPFDLWDLEISTVWFFLATLFRIIYAKFFQPILRLLLSILSGQCYTFALRQSTYLHILRFKMDTFNGYHYSFMGVYATVHIFIWIALHMFLTILNKCKLLVYNCCSISVNWSVGCFAEIWIFVWPWFLRKPETQFSMLPG